MGKKRENANQEEKCSSGRTHVGLILKMLIVFEYMDEMEFLHSIQLLSVCVRLEAKSSALLSFHEARLTG